MLSQAALRAAPFPEPPDSLSPSLSQSHLVHTEISWDFGDVAPPDWRWELTSSDPTAFFRLRWRHAGPEFDHAALVVYDAGGNARGELPVADGPVFADGYVYTGYTIGSLPTEPTLRMGVGVRSPSGENLGALSNLVQISAAPPADPYLYTPLAVHGIRESNGVPGIAGAVWCGETGEERHWNAGVRRLDGGPGPVRAGDLWHIGSDTKAMTTTVIGRLVQQGTPIPGTTQTLDWDTPIASIFPEWSDEIHPRFQSTTIRHLACHRSGLRMSGAEDAATRALGPGTLNHDPRDGRRQMTRQLLTRQHEEDGTPTVPGTRWFYGSGNYLILGAIIEQLTGQDYETAMRNLLFNPLFMTTARFGMPVDVGYYQPNGHQRKVLFPHEVCVDNYALEPVWNPAGGVYLSMADWLKFCRLHLEGREGLLSLDPPTLNVLHTPHPLEFPDGAPEDVDDPSYGWGWGIWTDSATGGKVLGHDGTYFRFYARVRIYLGGPFAVTTATNIGAGYGYGDKAVGQLTSHLVERTLGKLDDPRIMAGTERGGSLGSTGIFSVPRPEEETEFDLGAVLPQPPNPVTLGAAFTLAPLSAHDGYARALAAFRAAPRVTRFEPVTGGQFLLVFTSEGGAQYELQHLATLTGANWRSVGVVESAHGDRTAVVVDRMPGQATGFFRVDLADESADGPGP